MIHQIKTDYLVIGAGAVGLAFADTILSETDATITIVDKHHKPGGHWNDAYPFVTLHQPSAFYGVSSKELSKGRLAKVGLNKGLGELATGDEVMSYFDDLMRNTFLPSGRVQYFPMCEYQGEGKFTSILSGEQYQVSVNNKTVDATYFGTSVPSTHTPNFSVADDVDLRPLNDLPKLSGQHSNYVVVGGGKTGIDAVIWLLEHQVNPDSITWVMPRDAWLLNRKNTQSSEAFFAESIGTQAAQMEALAEAESIADLFNRLEDAGALLRIDRSVTPKMFHGATISELELHELRKVKNIVRKGRVTAINQDTITFEQGELPSPSDALYIDCSASAVTLRPDTPIFNGDTITIQTVRSFQPVFSAAFIAHIEATYDDEQKKNSLCTIVPLPNHDTDWIRCTGGQMMNQFIWSQEPGLREWLTNNRLDGFTALLSNVDRNDADKMKIVDRLKSNAGGAIAKLQQFMAQIQSEQTTKQHLEG